MNVSKWLKYLSLFGYTTLIFSAELFISQSAQTQTVVREFTPRYQTQAKGNIGLIGNTLMTCDENNTNLIGNRCPDVQSGNPAFSGNTNLAANNYFFMNYVDVDGDNSTFNSSSSQLTIPAGATVAWAGLYWSGDLSAGGEDPYTDPPGGVYGPGQAAPNPGSNNQAQLQVPGSGYQAIRADNIDQSGSRYSAYADVTSLVQSAGEGNYTMANVQAGTGGDRYAGWSLIVVYEDPNEKLRSLNVYDGFVFVNGPISTTISGFETPNSPGFEVELGAVIYEGDVALTGDQFRLNGSNLSDALNPADNFFNSSNTRLGSRFTAKNPDYVNQLAIDIDTVDATGLLNPGDTSASLEFTTEGDIYYPTAFTFATEIRQPVLTKSFTKTVLDINGGEVVAGDTLEYEITLENTGNETASDVIITDSIPENTTLVDGSLEVIQDPNSGNVGNKTNASGDDTAELNNNDAVFRVGTGATATQGGNLAPNESVTVKFQVQINPQINDTSVISNQASVNFNSDLTGTALDGVSDDPNTPQQNDATNIKVADPIVCNGREIFELSFRDPKLESGSDLAIGATYRFANVLGGIDALVTIDAFNNGASLADFDKIDQGSPDAFQPELSPTANPDSSVDFTISFVEAGTNTPISVDAFNASGVDIDGDSGNIREYIELDGFTSYLLETPTSLTATYTDPTGRFASTTTATQPGISINATQTIATGEFTNKSSFRYRIGALNSGSGTINRLNSLSFECIKFNNPQRDTPTTFDYGDAPDAYGSASHEMATTPSLYLGNIAPDSEANTQLGIDGGISATGDDNDGNDDEDAFVALPNVNVADQTVTSNYTLDVPLTNNSGNPATLHAWIDFNQNNQFELEEYQSATVNNNDTSANLDWIVPAGTLLNNTNARFRLTSTTLSDDPTTNNLDERSVGNAADGEVEDYPVNMTAPVYDYGDAPDTGIGTGTGNYRTTAVDGGASQVVVDASTGQVLSIGNSIDVDDGSLQNDSADADDNNGTPDDEDGITSFPLLTATAGQTYTVPVDVRNNVVTEAYLVGYIDLNQDGDFTDPGEQSATAIVPSDANPTAVPADFGGNTQTANVTFTIPAGAEITAGNTYARFRLGSVRAAAESASGASVDTDNGEIEDYQIAIASPSMANPLRFICDSSLYIVIGDRNVPESQLNRINRSTDPFTFEPIGPKTVDYNYNALAYNPNDNYLYAIVNAANASSPFESGEILRIGSDGIPVSLGKPQGDTLVSDPNSATFLADGTYVVAKKSNPIYTIDLNTTPPTATSRGTVAGTTFEDIAVNPYDTTPNRVYAIDDNSDRLVYFNALNPSTGATPAIAGGSTTTNHNHGSQFYDLAGNLLYRSATTDALYIVNPDGTDRLLAPTPDGGSHDGASCFAVGLEKEVDTSDPVPAGEKVTYTYRIGNSSAVPMTVTLTDDLRSVTDYPGSSDDESSTPVNGTYTGTINTPSGTVALSNSNQTITISDIALTPQSFTTITAEVTIPRSASPATYYNQATVQGLPSGFVSVVRSDYPPSAIYEDPTPMQVTEPIASNPNLLLVKRITAINPGQSDEVQFNNFIDDGTADNADNDPNWPDSDSDPNNNTNTYLRGAIDGGLIKPGDEIEYTIYFLSNGDAEARNVKICDVIPDNMTFLKDIYGIEVGMALGLDDTSLPDPDAPNKNLSNVFDTDEGNFYAAGTNPPAGLCKKVGSGNTLVEVDENNNNNGAIVIDLDSLPAATSSGNPTNSYGFIRFRTEVK